MKTVRVLLSSYNGEKYIGDQIESILRQEGVDLEIVIRDDGSTDNTLKIIEGYSKKDKRIIYYTGNNLGPCFSFFELLKSDGKADYYAFCDQDDVWDKDKLKIAINKLDQIEENIPTLYYSNLRVVDEQLHFIRNSFSDDRTIKNKFSSLITFVAIGCTEVFNHALKEMMVQHIPSHCLMHDAWALTIASFFGKTYYDSEPHIMYRQHQNNVVGTNKNKMERALDRLKRLANKGLQPRLFHTSTFYEQFSNELESEEVQVIMRILNYKKSIKARIALLLEKKIHTLSVGEEIRYRGLIIAGLI